MKSEKIETIHHTELFSSSCMNRILLVALTLLLMKGFLERNVPSRSDARRSTKYLPSVARNQPLKIDFAPLVALMQRYTSLVTRDDGSGAVYSPEVVTELLKELRLERRRYYRYLDHYGRRYQNNLSPRQKRSLRYYLSAIEKAIQHLNGEMRKRQYQVKTG